jgi:hypothetical protein
VACGIPSNDVLFVEPDGACGQGGGGQGVSVGGDRFGQLNCPVALAVVPGLGLVVREFVSSRLQVLVPLDALAMASMSHVRVAWMGAVVRGATAARAHGSGPPGTVGHGVPPRPKVVSSGP